MRAKILSLRDLTPEIREFTLAPESGAESYPPGSHLILRLTIRGRIDERRYSLIGAAGNGTWRIAVRRADDGRGGSLAMWSLRVGDDVETSKPQSRFALSRSAPERLLIAGGVGITPLIGMAEALTTRGDEFRMLYTGRSRPAMAYHAELQAKLGDRLSLFANDENQWLSLAEAFADLHPNGEAYVCGPPTLLAAAQAAWAADGRPASHLRFESFGGGAGYADTAFTVRVPRLNCEATVAIGQSMLEALEAAGVEMMWGCRRGECGLCAVEILSVEGTVDHRDVFFSARQKQGGRKLCPCVSRVAGDSVTIEIAYRGDDLEL